MSAPAAATGLRISVITPSFGQAEFLEDCLRSVAAQSHPGVEHLVLDGGSQDGSLEILARHAGRPGLRFWSEPDRGQAHAINKGFDLASGDIVCWLNCDDLFFDANVLARVAAVFAAHPEVQLVVGDGYRADRHGRLLAPIVLDPEALNTRRMRQADFVLQPSAFWRRSALRLDESYDYAFDWLFFVQMFEQGHPCYYLRDYLSIYRFYGSNKTAQDGARRKREILRLLRRNLGAFDPSTLWAGLVWAGYALAETSGQAWLKAGVRKANAVLATLTRYRLGTG
jgi:glycosyltransferase involved in cell wall biosynthesis